MVTTNPVVIIFVLTRVRVDLLTKLAVTVVVVVLVANSTEKAVLILFDS